MKIEERVDKVEEAISIMKSLLVNHDERLEDYFKALNEFREDFQFKMNALVDAQIKNESEIAGVKESVVEVKESLIEVKESIIELRKSTTELKEASQSQLNRIENLENK